MKIFSVLAGYFKLDGGAMFGVVPKSIWQGLNPADERNLCRWALRCLLIEHGNRLVLIDCGLGTKQDEKFFRHYEPHGNETIESELQRLGFSVADVTDVILTHLHFDHCGGAVSRHDQRLVPTFPRATYYCHQAQWHAALKPNAREKASFLPENFLPLQEHECLQLVGGEEEILPGVSLRTVYGHTDAMLIPVISYRDVTVVYMADLIPSAAHIPVPYVMAYDIRPLDTLSEKEILLQQAVDQSYVLFFEHDPNIEAATVTRTEKGFRLKESIRISEL